MREYLADVRFLKNMNGTVRPQGLYRKLDDDIQTEEWRDLPVWRYCDWEQSGGVVSVRGESVSINNIG